MRTLFEAALAAAALFCGVMWQATDFSLKGLLLHYKEKGYTRPTKQELDACIRKAVRMKISWRS